MAERNNQIDTPQSRLTRFLAGLVIALTLLFVALQYRSGGSLGDFADDSSGNTADDVELMHEQRPSDMIPAVLPGKSQKAVPADIKKVDTPPAEELPAKPDQPAGTADAGDELLAEHDQAGGEDTAPQAQATDMQDNPLNFRIVEQLPEFPGGMVELMKWITRNLRYPPVAQRHNIQGKVVVAFIVGKDGSLSEIKVVQKADPLLDNEALRVVRKMPKWKPGQMKGKPCETYFCIPVIFKI